MKQKSKQKEPKYLTYQELYDKYQGTDQRRALIEYCKKNSDKQAHDLSPILSKKGEVKADSPNFRMMYNFGNCKNLYFCNIKYCIYTGKSSKISQQFLDMVENLVSYLGYVTFSVNVTELEYLEVIESRFKLIDYMALPIGYGQGFQYHAVFFSYVSTAYERRVDEAHEKKLCRSKLESGGRLLNIKDVPTIEVKPSFFGMLTGKILNKLKIK